MICAVILGFTVTASAQTDNKAEFKFVEEKHDFGKIPQGKPVTTEFTFTNIGEEPLILSNVQPTCGCTIADFTKTPVLKGAKGVIKITYNAAVASVFSKTIVVTSNAKTPTKNLIIMGEVMPAAAVAGSK
ncbi:uncharacterized protein DUF1573 [Mucilaginibacter gracilis]|uniref:Uncharacterized protein DUF1573 n=2 Tax=Mucilaginibacter gracilis TaxID=423350 RepID=A0A495J6L8_9SPHI|nr:uncharacterized protein DUF1573 [Mucilaginibacter gracilis]